MNEECDLAVGFVDALFKDDNHILSFVSKANEIIG